MHCFRRETGVCFRAHVRDSVYACEITLMLWRYPMRDVRVEVALVNIRSASLLRVLFELASRLRLNLWHDFREWNLFPKNLEDLFIVVINAGKLFIRNGLWQIWSGFAGFVQDAAPE